MVGLRNGGHRQYEGKMTLCAKRMRERKICNHYQRLLSVRVQKAKLRRNKLASDELVCRRIVAQGIC